MRLPAVENIKQGSTRRSRGLPYSIGSVSHSTAPEARQFFLLLPPGGVTFVISDKSNQKRRLREGGFRISPFP